MITHIAIDGFKSLVRFRLRLKVGLNVLIGPNGAGKSNICQALGLIAAAAEDSLADYILSLGGVGSAFTTGCGAQQDISRSRRMNVSCEGITTFRRGGKTDKLAYNYRLALDLSDELKIRAEAFKLFKVNGPKDRLEILTARLITSRSQVRIEIPNTEEAGPLWTLARKEGTLEVPPRGPLSSMLSILPLISGYCDSVRDDMAFSRAWNIDPHVAKKSSDILEPTMMQADGRRLANAIHLMEESSDKHLDDVKDFMGHVLPRFRTLNVVTSDDSLTRSFSITDRNGICCPASCLSDGTIKALALLVGVFGQPNSMCIIEEPENYLHPWAAQSLIDFFRDHFAEGVCVLTTHSETILNSVRPREILVIENSKGRTVRRKLSSRRSLVNAIRKSGFGPGYHYMSGALGGVPE